MQFNIDSDIEQVIKEVGTTFEKDIPFTVSQSMNDTLFETRRWIIAYTWRQAFTVRNKAFPGRLFKVKKTTKRDLNGALFQQPLPSKGGGSPNRDYVAMHATGGTKTPTKGAQSIAIPQNIDRGASGRISIAKKPRRLREKKSVFVRRGNKGNRAILQRQGKDQDPKLWYMLVKSAKISKSFRFFEDGIETIETIFPARWLTRMNAVISKSRFRGK